MNCIWQNVVIQLDLQSLIYKYKMADAWQGSGSTELSDKEFGVLLTKYFTYKNNSS